MAGVNKVILIGHLGKDPKVSTLNSGSRVVTFSIATSESWKDKNTGERKERTEWHNIVIFNEGLVGIAESYLRKGSKVYLEGQLRTRKYMDQANVERQVTEVVLAQYRGELALLDKADRAPPEESDYGATRAGGRAGGGHSPVARPADIDDDIPF